MKLNSLTTVFAILATLAFLPACGEDSEETTSATPTTETAPEADEPTAEPAGEPAAAEGAAAAAAPAAGGAGDGVCARAVACCEAYVSAAGANTPGMNVETTCAGVRQLSGTPGGDGACTNAITGWRTGLQALQREIPAPCAE